MRKPSFVTIALVLLLAASTAMAGQAFPDITMSGQLTPENRQYLGVSSDTIKFADINAEYVFVEAFSMYCPVCQRDAPHINEVYKAISGMDTGNAIRFIGLGLGNTPYEVEFYRKKFNVDFPLFHDQEYVIHKALGEISTPTFYLVKLAGGAAEIVYQREGEVKSGDVLIKAILEKTSLK